MSPVGQRGYRIGLLSVVVCGALYGLGLWRGVAPIDLGIGLAAMIAGAASPSTVRAVFEWQARARDQSTIAEQTQAAAPPPAGR